MSAAAGSFGELGDMGDIGVVGIIGDASVMDADAVAAELHVDVDTGLSAPEAARRLAQKDRMNCVRRPGQRPGGVCWRSSRTR